MDQHIDSLNHPLAQTIAQCLQHSDNRNDSLILIEDEDNILTALQQGIEVSHIIATEEHTVPDKLLPLLNDHTVSCTIKKRTIKKIFGNTRLSHLFVLAKRPRPISLNDTDSKHDLLVLDGLAITGNIGAICRSAAAFGVTAMVVTRATIDPYDRRIIRASRGQVFRCPIITCTPCELITHCQQTSRDIVVLDANANIDISALPQHHKAIAMVFGSEKEGIDHSLQQAAKLKLSIPMHHALDSLNVSVAVGICLYQRHGGKHLA